MILQWPLPVWNRGPGAPFLFEPAAWSRTRSRWAWTPVGRHLLDQIEPRDREGRIVWGSESKSETEGEIMGRRSGMMEEDGAATKPGGRARGGWAARFCTWGLKLDFVNTWGSVDFFLKIKAKAYFSPFNLHVSLIFNLNYETRYLTPFNCRIRANLVI